MPFDLFNPSTWFQQDQPQGTAAPNDPIVQPIGEGEKIDATKKTLVVCPVHGDMVTQAVADAHVAAKEIEDQKAAEAKAAEEKRIADEKAQADIKAAADQQAITDQQNTAIAQEQKTSQVDLERQKYIPGTAASQQFLADQQQQTDIENNLRNLWMKVATTNEKYNATMEPSLNIVTKDMVTDNPLDIKLGGLVVKTTSEQEMADLLRFITDNRGYLPTGGTPLGGEGTMDVARYKTLVENEKTLDTPERQSYQYWQMQQNRSLRYDEDATKLAEILDTENERRTAAGLDEIKADQLRGVGAIYADRVKRHAGRLESPDVIQTRIDESRATYAASLNERILSTGMTVNPQNPNELIMPNGWATNREFNGAWSYKTPEGQTYKAQEIMDNPDLVRQFGEAITPQMVDQFKKEVRNQPEVVDQLLQSIGENPVTKVLLEKAYPGHTKEGVIDQYIEVAQRQKQPVDTKQPMPMILQDMIDSVGKVYQDNPTFIQAATQFINDPSKPDALKNLGLALARDMSDPTGSMRMFEVVQNIWERGVSSGWRDVPYDEWQEKTLKEATGGATPAMRVGIGAGAASLMANSDIKLQHFIAEWSNPLIWITGGEAIAEGEVAVKIIKGAERKTVVEAAELAAKETGKAADDIIKTAENRVAKAVESVVVPDNIVVPETKPAIGQVFGEGISKDAEGNLVKTENVPYRVIKEGETIPAEYIEQNGKIYVPDVAEVKPTVPATTEKPPAAGPPPGAEPPTGTPPGQPAQAEMNLGKVETTADLQTKMEAKYPNATPEQIEAAVKVQEAKMARTSPAMAEIETKLADVKARIKGHSDKGIFERGAINDPEVKQAYNDLVEAAGLYIKKGVLTVEEFAKELGVKVNDLVRQAWDDVSQAGREADDLNAALDLPKDARPVLPQRSALSEGQMQVAHDEIVKRIKAAREVLAERKGAVKELRGQQKAAGMAADQAAGGGEAGFLAGRAAMKGEAEKVYTGLGQAEFEQSVRDWVIDAPKRAYAENPAIFYKSKKGEFFTPANAQEALIRLMADESLPEFEVKLLEKVYGVDFIETVKNTPAGMIQDILGIFKTILASIDHSFPGRQGWIINVANPEIGAKSIKNATAAFWSEKYADALKESVLSRPSFKRATEAGLEITDTGMVRTMREESYPSRIMDKVPGIKQSERSFTWSANAQRMDAWDKFEKWLGPDAATKDMEMLADLINMATGRGDLGKFSRLGAELNTVLFSPKLFAARIQLPLKSIPMTLNPRLRAIYWRNVGTSIGVSLTALGMFKAISQIPEMKDKVYVATDLRSSDFGKVIIGDTHIDVTGGNAQLIYLMARVFTGTRMSGGGMEYDTNSWDELMRYLRYKSSPIMGLGYDVLTQKSVSGKKFGTKDYWTEKALGSVIPMALQDIGDAYTYSGIGGALAVIPLTVYGIGVNTYETGATTQEKRLGSFKYSDEQLSAKTAEAKDKYMKAGEGDALGELAVQAKLDAAAAEYYTTVDLRTYLRRSGASEYKATPLQKYFNECIPIFDKWEADAAVKDSKQHYSTYERTALSFWGVIKTSAGNKGAAKKKMTELGLPKEAAPWLY